MTEPFDCMQLRKASGKSGKGGQAVVVLYSEINTTS